MSKFLTQAAKIKKTLTSADIKKYVKERGAKCPYCGSKEVEAGELDPDVNITCVVSCGKCHNEWTDVYTLTDMSP